MSTVRHVTVTILSVSIAVYALVLYGFFPLGTGVHPALRESFELHRLGLYMHVFAAATALLLGPFQFVERLRTRRRSLHRWLGRIYLFAGVFLGGLSGFYLAHQAFGGPAARIGFAGLALSWLFTGLRAFLAILGGDIDAHRCWMVRNFALSFAAVMLRLWIPAALLAGIAFEAAYPVIAWLCWVPNILLAELMVRRPALLFPRRGEHA